MYDLIFIMTENKQMCKELFKLEIDVWFDSEIINNLDLLDPITIKEFLTEEHNKYWQPFNFN